MPLSDAFSVIFTTFAVKKSAYMASKTYSKGDYKRLSERIRLAPDNVSVADLEMLQALRVTYKEPLSTVFKVIEHAALKIDRKSISTYRVKRIESIINKLSRFPEMQVQRMEDIAGCRVIMTSQDNIFELFDKIQKDIDRLPFEIKGKINNYIETPKPSGYRSLHFNVTLRDTNQRIEVQLRCLDQHYWATMVEISDVVYRARLKEYGEKGNSELFEFHRLLAKEDDELTAADRRTISDIASKYRYIERISTIFSQNYLDVRQKWNKMRLQKKAFFLIATTTDGVPDFEGFTNFEEAENAYFELYNANDEQRNIVLTHLQSPSFTTISIAYSNYFLTYNRALLRILQILTDTVTRSYQSYNMPRFVKYYRAYLDIMRTWSDNKFFEMSQLNTDENVSKSVKKRKEWIASMKSDFASVNAITRDMNRKINRFSFRVVPYFIKHTMDAQYRRARRREERKRQSS